MIGSPLPTHWITAFPLGALRLLQRSTLLALLIIANRQPLAAQDKLLPVFNFERLTTANGLPTDEIPARVVRDSRGLVWIGTEDGLVRFDGHSCKVYRNDPGDAGSLSSNVILSLHVDMRGRLWVGTFTTGLSLYDADHDHFVNFLPRDSDSTWLQSKSIGTLHEDGSGNLWCGSLEGKVLFVDLSAVPDGTSPDSMAGHIRFRTFQGFRNTIWAFCDWDDRTVLVASDNGLFVTDPGTGNRKRPGIPASAGITLDTVRVSSLCWETPRRLWLGTCDQGLYLYDRATRLTTAYHRRPAGTGKRRDDQILDAVFDKDGRFWVATWSGLDLFNPLSGSYEEYLTSSGFPFGQVMSLSVDAWDNVWVGTAVNGLFLQSPASYRFPHYALKGRGTTPMSMESIQEDKDGTLWIRAEGKMIQVQPTSLNVLQTIDLYKGAKSKYGGQGGSYVHGSYVDRGGRMWHGSMGSGIYRVEPATGTVLNFRPSTQISNLPYNTDVCASITGGTGNSLWVAGFKDGLFQFDTYMNRFSDQSDIFGQRLANVLDVAIDDAGNVWAIDQVFGLLRFNPTTERIDRFGHKADQRNSLSDDDLVRVYKDQQGRIWVGGRTLNLWDPENNGFRHFPNAGFREARSSVPRLSDRRGNVWVWYTGKGLGVLDPKTATFANYDPADGLVGANDMAQLHDGRVALVGYGGMNIVDPDSLYKPQVPPPIAFTEMTVNDTQAVSPKGIPGASGLFLPYNHNVIEFEFAAIDPGAVHLIEYFYRLEGLENDWVHTNGRRSVRYPGLSPGEYVMRVKAVNRLGRWPDQEVSLSVVINPPWWQSRWSYAAYVAILLGSLFAAYRVRMKGIQLKQRAEMEHFQAEHLAEVDRLKSRFFANISHEFRTPLTLILGPADRVMETTEESSTRQSVHLIKDNAKKLFGLVNQLLEFSRLESGMIRLQVSSGEIVQFLRRVVLSFESWAERKRIHLEFRSDAESKQGYFDADKLEKIVNNLVSNAVKFTAEGGQVCVDVSLSPSLPRFRSGSERNRIIHDPWIIDKEGGRGGEWVMITISDTGPGIAPEHLPHIFDRFYRADETHTTEGTGIGLALTKELVDLHHGTITVESSPGKGSVFVAAVPIGKSAYLSGEIVESPPPAEEKEYAGVADISEATNSPPSTPVAEGKPIVLVVEDNVDLRAHIRDFLSLEYAVHEAGNGKQGYEVAMAVVPDLVISDVMMPEMDGMEFCRALKKDVRTSHIPVILLTARASTDSRIEGLEIGADDYVTKPFESKELVARVRNLIEQRRQLRARFSSGVVLKPGEVAVTSIDDALLRQIMDTVEKNMGNENFGVDDLAKEAFLSRRHLSRKVHALTNLSPGEFIRYVRLQRARELLEKGAGSVAEIAYQVGFGNMSHFSASFRVRFGVLPSEIRGGQPHE